MFTPEYSDYYNRIYIKILDIKTGNDLTSISTITVEYNGTTYNTSKSPNGPNVYDIYDGFPNLTTSVSVICHADCEGYAPSNVRCNTINNYDTTLTLTTLSLHKEYPKTIAGQIERINDAKADIKAAIIDKGGTVNDTDKLDSYSKIIDQITSRFNEYNYEYNGIADDDGLKAIGWNDLDIAYFKYNNLHPKSENVGDTYKVSDANKQIKITSINDISTNKDNTNFKYCPKFDTSNVTSMYDMFYKCTSLTSVPLFDTSKVTRMSSMFYNCTSLISVPLFDTSKVTNMYDMFYKCTSLTSVPLFDTSKVTNMNYMLSGCTSLTSVPLFDTSNVTDMGGMFSGCRSLTSVPLFDTSKVTKMVGMFEYCRSLTSVPLFDTSNVTDMGSMFYDCSSLTTLGGFTGLKVNLNLSSCPLLTKESILNVFNKAANVKSKTLTLGTTNLSKLTSTEKAIATNKGWVLK